VISVVIPARDAAATIGEQLDALSAQPGIGDCEVVVADNGSTDSTVEVVRRKAGVLPVRCVDASERRGAAAARNIGAAAATGDLVCFVDADDVVLPGWLAAWRDAEPTLEFGTGPVVQFVGRAAPTGPVDTAPAPPVHMGFLPYAFGGNCAIRRDRFVRAGGFPVDWRIAEDIVFSWRLQLDGTPLAYVRGAAVARRIPSDAGLLLRKYYAYGRVDARLARQFRPSGLPPARAWPTARTYLGLVARLPLLARPETRRRWLTQLGRRTGRIVGAWHERCWYP
jgi:glycosyltransferase involved in cell wall biosynthesis